MQHRRDLVLRRGPRREAEAAQPEEEREGERGGEDDPRQDEAVDRDDRAEDRDGAAAGAQAAAACVAIPNASETAACATSSTPSDAASFASGDGGPQRPERDELDQHAERDEDDERDDQRGGRRRVPAVDAGLERPVGVAGDHRDGAGREVDDPRAAVGQDDAEGDPGDQRAGAEPEDREEEELVPVHAEGQPGGGRGRRRAAPPLEEGRRLALRREVGRRPQPAAEALEDALAHGTGRTAPGRCRPRARSGTSRSAGSARRAPAGPLKALIVVVNFAAVSFETPIWFIIFTVVRIWPHATITQASPRELRLLELASSPCCRERRPCRSCRPASVEAMP